MAALLCVGGLATSTAQRPQIETWVDVTPHRDGTTSFTAYAQGLTGTRGTYDYELLLSKSDQNGSSTERAAGSVTFAGGEVERLADLSTNVSYHHRLAVRLELRDSLGAVVARFDEGTPGMPSPAIQTAPKATAPSTRVSADAPADAATSAPTPSEPAPTATASAIVDLEINGLIIDETRSKTGRDFYDAFYANWQPPADVGSFTITLRETPSRGRAVRIAVDVTGTTVYTPFIQPRQEVIEATAIQASRRARDHLTQQRQLNLEIDDPDQTGDGLY